MIKNNVINIENPTAEDLLKSCFPVSENTEKMRIVKNKGDKNKYEYKGKYMK